MSRTNPLAIETPLGRFQASIVADGFGLTSIDASQTPEGRTWISDDARVSACQRSEVSDDHGFVEIKLRFELTDALDHLDIRLLSRDIDAEPEFQRYALSQVTTWSQQNVTVVLVSRNWRWIQTLSRREIFPVFEETVSWDSFTHSRNGLVLRLDQPRPSICGAFDFVVGWGRGLSWDFDIVESTLRFANMDVSERSARVW